VPGGIIIINALRSIQDPIYATLVGLCIIDLLTTAASTASPQIRFSAIRIFFLGARTCIEPRILVGILHEGINMNELVISHPNTRALTSTLSRGLAPTGLLESSNAECGTLPPFSLSKHSSSNLSLFSMPDQ